MTAAMQIYWKKRKCLHKKRVQLPQEHQHGRCFIVLEHQQGYHDIMRIGSKGVCEITGSDEACGFCISRGKLDEIMLFILLYSDFFSCEDLSSA